MIVNTVNGKCYVGSTINRVTRLKYHRYLLRKGRHSNPYLQAAWNLHGEAAFKFEWICDVPEDQLLDTEQEWIDANAGGYNIARDARAFAKGLKWTAERKAAFIVKQTGRKLSAETRKKIGDVQRGVPKGPRSAEHCRRLSETMKGHKNFTGHTHSAETRKRLSEINLGNKHFLGRKHSEETKAKISEKRKGRKLSQEQRQILLDANIGRKASAETRAKMSMSQKLRQQRNRELKLQGAQVT